MPIDNRTERRRTLSRLIPAEVTPDGPANASLPCTVMDIAETGLCLRAPEPLGPGRCVQIVLAPEEGEIELVGQIIWIRPAARGFRMGCQFTALDPESKSRLAQLLKRLPPREDLPAPRPGK